MIAEILSRRSIRRFTDEMPSREQLEAVLTAGALAPSGKNKQPWRFVVLGGGEKQRVLNAMEQGLAKEAAGEGVLPESAVWGIADAKNTLSIMRSAPITVLVLNPFGKTPFEPIPPEKRITELVDTQSVGACIENMLLEAEHQGLGGLWVCNTFFAYRELCVCLNTEDTLLAAVVLGVAAEQPPARPLRALEDIVEYRL